MLKRLLILLLLACNCKPVSAKVNLALHKSYTFSPKPNYRLCTDELDVIQLTDGKTYGSRWTEKSTVGWDKAESPAEIVIDLGKRSAVYEVRIHTVGGGFANVEFPEYAAVLLSNDGREFQFGGLITSRELANVRGFRWPGIARTLKVENINAVGRYVKVVIRAEGRYVFLDEIEVLGEQLSVTKHVKLRNDLEVFKTSEELLSRIEEHFQLGENIAATVKAVKENQARLPVELSEKILSRLEILAQKADVPTNKMYSTRELLSIKGELGKIRARIYQAVYKRPFACLPANPMEIVYEKKMCFQKNLKEIAVWLWRNEYESAAFNIVNCADEAITMSVSISPLAGPTGKMVDSDSTFTVRRAVYVKSRPRWSRVASIADALVLQGERPFVLQPGELTQIWLTVFNPALTAGDYKGSLAVAASPGPKKLPIETIKLNLKVENITFPQDVTLNTCTWDEYTWYNPVTEDVMPVVSEDLQAHYVNVSVIHPYLIPGLRLNDKYSHKFGKELQVKDFARTYLLYFEWWSGRKDSGRFGKWMSPGWKREFSAWLRRLVALLKEKGIGYERFALYPFDEALCDEFYQVAKLIKQVDPKIRIYANNFGKGPRDFIRFRNLIDIWCPHWVHCKAHPEWLATIRSFGKEIWTYGGEAKAPAKTRPPYGYYRLIAWDAFKWGQTGVGFWVYIDRKVHAWNDTLRPVGYYAVIYGADGSPVDTCGEKIIPSRRWEVWREGIEDYEYLVQLQKAINKARISNPQAAVDAEATLNLQVKRVVNNRADSEIVYSARQVITKTLLQLRQLGR